MKRLGHRQQRTLARPAALTDRGLLAGRPVQVTFRPAPPNTGLVFVRTDLRQPVYIPATHDLVTDTRRRTTLGHAPHSVSLAEHVLAALAGLRIDNCWIELNGAEPPGLDGSAARFVSLLMNAGIETQSAPRAIWTVASARTIQRGSATLTIHPDEVDELRISYLLDYGPDSPIIRQRHTSTVTPASFARDLSGCRTFVLSHEAEELRRQGVGRHVSSSEVLIFGPRGPMDNQLNRADEPARHKILDIVGDLALLGVDLRGHVVGYRSGHPLNVALVRDLAEAIGKPALRPMLRAAA